jgi:hypothetical protein
MEKLMIVKNVSVKKYFPLIIGCIIQMTGVSVYAGVADYVYTPIVEEGEREIDFKYGNAKQADGIRAQASSIGYGYGVTNSWFTEIYYKREIANPERFSLAEWENKFQLTESGKYPVDVGFIVEVEAPLGNSKSPVELRMGPLLQTEFGKLQLNGNLLFERQFGRKDLGEKHVTEMGYQWQVKYRWKKEFEFGLQGLGDLGQWDDWEKYTEQNHRMGPAIFGKFSLGGYQAIQYNVAWLLGLSDAAPNHTLRMQIEYEF